MPREEKKTQIFCLELFQGSSLINVCEEHQERELLNQSIQEISPIAQNHFFKQQQSLGTPEET